MASQFRGSAALAVLLLLSDSVGAADVPASPNRIRFYTDQELALSPVIVLAKWEKAPVIYEGEMGPRIKETKFKILRVIQGEGIQPGEYRLRIGLYVAWHEEGGLSESRSMLKYGTRQSPDLTQPNLWFFEQKFRPGSASAISDYREVQPGELEAYFAAFRSESPRKEVPKLLDPKSLKADQQEVSERVLRYISGGGRLWPYDGGSHVETQLAGVAWRTQLRDEAPRVWAVVNSQADALRPLAAQVYAHIKGDSGRAEYRTLLSDRNPTVRAIAVGALVKSRDASSIEKMRTALRGVDKPHLVWRLLDAISDWNDERAVPLLIDYLQNVELKYQSGTSTFEVPAFQARYLLHKVTDYWFPPDVARATAVWQKAEAAEDKFIRVRLLRKLLPEDEFPVRVDLIRHDDEKKLDAKVAPAGTDSFATVRIRNITREPLMIAAIPTDVRFNTSGRGSSGHSSKPLAQRSSGNSPFVTIAPDQAHEFDVTFPREEMAREAPHKCTLHLTYLKNGQVDDRQAWIGKIRFTFKL